jgi:hypothetical protein
MHRDSGFSELVKAVEERMHEDKKILDNEELKSPGGHTIIKTNVNTTTGTGNIVIQGLDVNGNITIK